MVRRFAFIWSVASICLFAGCGGGGSSPTTSANATGGGKPPASRLEAAGSTFVYPMMSKWASEYDKTTGVKVNYQSQGSGAGIQQMTAMTVNFGCTDGPMNEEQLGKAKESGGEVVHIPLAMGAVVVAYNLNEVKDALIFSGPVLADIFLGKITKWNDDAIKKLNPSAALPDKSIAVVHRSEGSGTTYIWVDYLAKVSPVWKEKVGVGTSVNWPCGIGSKGNEGVAGQVKRSSGSIGYVELTYASQNNIPFGHIINKEGAAITPSLASVTAAADAALSNIPDDLRYSLTDAPGKESYPISGTVWAVAYVKQKPGTGQAIANFLRWVTHEGQELTAALHYSRLPKGLVERLDKKIDQIAAGSK
jgi:phosphate ABC transporter phosphate-binding protein